MNNNALGGNALYSNLTGGYNTAVGRRSLYYNTSGNHNTAIGNEAGVNRLFTDLENTTAIGDSAIVSTSNTIQLGNTSVTNVKTSGTITAGNVTYPKIDGANGQVLTTTGSGTLSWTTVTADAGTLTGTTLNATVIGSSLTSVGTITTGVWSGTTIAVAKGGTGMTSAGTDGQVLTSTGSGTLTWTTVSSGGGVTIVGPISGTADIKGATISGTTITLTPADALNGGIVTTGVQTFVGPKTFSSTDGLKATGTFGSGTPSSIGPGTRMMWYPKKAAFRAGAVSSDQWDDANIGNYSTAMGYGAMASGPNSTAMGNSTNASGANSTAMGNGTIASGFYSTAMGAATTASGDNSTAMGDNTTATSFAETVIGTNNTAYIPASTSEFNGGDRLFVIGNGAYGARSDALVMLKNGNTSIKGSLTLNGYDGFLSTGTMNIGSGIPISGPGTRMMWYPKIAAFRAGDVSSTQWDVDNIGDFSIAMGSSTLARGFSSNAIGYYTTASGDFSTAMGNYSTASGENSTALGYYTTANGAFSTAMGNTTTASGNSSTALGNTTTASGNSSTALGDNTSAASFAETVIGTYNTVYTPTSTTAFSSGDRLFVIGNGASSAVKSNALVMLKNGNTTFSATVTASVVAPTSDKRLKRNIAPLHNSMEAIMQLKPVSYEKKNTLAATDYSIKENGFIAQELQKIMPNLVIEGTDKDKLLSVNYTALIPVLTKAIQEQQKAIQAQQKAIQAQQKQIEELKLLVLTLKK